MDTFGAREAFTWMASPVCGLRAVRALRSTRSKEMKPVITTFSPFLTLVVMIYSKVFRKVLASVFDEPVFSASASINSVLFTEVSFVSWYLMGLVPHHRGQSLPRFGAKAGISAKFSGDFLSFLKKALMRGLFTFIRYAESHGFH